MPRVVGYGLRTGEIELRESGTRFFRHEDPVASRTDCRGGGVAFPLRGESGDERRVRRETARRENDRLRPDPICPIRPCHFHSDHPAVLHEEIGRPGIRAKVNLKGLHFIQKHRRKHLTESAARDPGVLRPIDHLPEIGTHPDQPVRGGTGKIRELPDVLEFLPLRPLLKLPVIVIRRIDLIHLLLNRRAARVERGGGKQR